MGEHFSLERLRARLAMLTSTGRYWVAYSGGLDSHVLLHAMAALAKEHRGWELSAAHIHHGLQAQAHAWSEHCQEVCAELAVGCRIVRVDATPSNGESPEAAARRARYDALASLLREGDGMLAAHHQDDQAETLLLHLLRGSGPQGLAAMPVCRALGRGWLGRPLLGFPRAALRAYAGDHGLKWIEDPSNLERRYQRNFVRHEVIPVLKGRQPGLPRVLARAARHQAEAAELLDELAGQDLVQVRGVAPGTLDLPVLGQLTPARQRNVLRRWLRELGLPVPAATHLDKVLEDVLPASYDAQPLVHWPGCDIRRFQGSLYAMTPLEPTHPTVELMWDPAEPLRTPYGLLSARRVKARGLAVGCSSGRALNVRFRRGGERCHPQERAHGRSLKKLLQEAGVPPWQRDRLPLVYVGGTLAAVPGLWVCRPFQSGPEDDGWELDWQPETGGYHGA